jgi:membrane protein YqaA with SNARE-associated domain
MKAIKHLLARYTTFLWTILAPLGAWGVFAVAAIDGAALGLPVDVIVGGYVAQNHSRWLLYVLMAATGSALGSLVVYAIGYTGGEELLRKRVSAERFAKLHDAFEQHPFWSLMFPAILPPPTPFKLFVMGAAVAEMSVTNFLLAIFLGRALRFLLLAILVLKFGPGVVNIMRSIPSHYLYWVLLTGLVLLAVFLLARSMRKRKQKRSSARQLQSNED